MGKRQETRGNGHPTARQLAAYVTGELSAEELLETGDHIASCPDCADSLAAPGMRYAVLEVSASDDHLSFEDLSTLADKDAEPSDHVSYCDLCRKALDDIITLREDLEAYDAPAEVPEGVESGSRWRILQMLKWSLIPSFCVLVAAAILIWTSYDRNGPPLAADSNIPQASPAASTAPPPPAVEKLDPAPAQITIRLMDGNRVVTVDSEGNVSGIDPPELARKARMALERGEFKIDTAGKELAGDTGVLMGRDNPAVPFRLQSPVGTVIEARRPRFHWEPEEGAESYRVVIIDEDFNRVATSGEIEKNNWTVPGSLDRGKTYTWQVIATKGEEEIRSPVRPAPDARFRIISAAASRSIAEARRSRSSLLLGLAYAEAGMLREAEREFIKLTRKNPNSRQAAELLRKIRSVR